MICGAQIRGVALWSSDLGAKVRSPLLLRVIAGAQIRGSGGRG